MNEHRNYLIILLLILLLISCRSNNDVNLIEVKLKEISRFGSEKGNEDEIIGSPGDVAIDKHGNVYISDFAFKKIKKISPDGKFLKNFGNGEGEGPGDFLEPRSIDIDSSGNLYVTDMKLRTITIFDSTGNIIKHIKTQFQPAFVQAFSLDKLYLIGFPNTYTGNLIHKFNLNENNHTPELTFGNRFKGKNSFEIENSGFVDRILKDAFNNKVLYKSDFFPYSIKAYNLNGELLSELTREIMFYKPPYIKNKKPLYIFPVSGAVALTQYNENILINYIIEMDEENKEMRTYLDFWDISKKKFLGNFSSKELGVKLGRYILCDGKGFFYNYEPEPYPHITKYKMEVFNRK